jgi:3-oxoacyl-[acyl-carrier-protein] synthase I
MSSNPEVASWLSRPGEEVCICGVGARTAIGLSADASAAAVRGGISGLKLHPSFTDQEYEPVSFAADPAIAPDVPLAERMLLMVHSVVEEVRSRIPPTIQIDRVWLALPESRAGLPADLAQRLAAALSAASDFGRAQVHSLSRGHASGLMALQAAAQVVARENEIALVIGVDSYHDATTINSLDLHRRLMSERNRSGFPPGEAGGACLLVRRDTAERLNLPALAHILAAATATEPHTLRSSEPCLGEGLTAVVASVAGHLRVPEELMTTTYCDLNGERYRNEEYVYALLRTQQAFVDAHDYVAPADCWGDVGAASGLLFAVLAIVSSVRGYAKGTVPLLWAGSDAGYRSAIALRLARN